MKRLLLLSLCAVLAGCSPKPQVQWQRIEPKQFSESMLQGRPTVLYFYAAWCGPCNALKEYTFSDERVIAALEPFQRIRVDMSFQHSAAAEAISARFRIDGLPSILFFDKTGRERQRISGFVEPEGFLENLTYG